MKNFVVFALLALALTVTGAQAENIHVAGELVGFPTPPSWRLVATGVDFNDEYVYIWVDAEGNCRYEYRQECYTNPDGQVICRQIPEWKCDRDSAFYKLPQAVSVDEGAKRAYFTPDEGPRLTIGKVKQFLWSKWVSLYDGARLSISHDSATMLLDPEALAGSLHKDNFRELYSTRVD